MRKLVLSITVLFLSFVFIPNTHAQIKLGKKKLKTEKKTGYDLKGDLIKIGGPFSDNGITSDIHEKYIGKIMFAKDIIPATGANESDFVSEFGISDFIYGRLYMPHSVENYPIYENKSLVAGDTINPDHNNYGKFYYKLYVDGVLDEWPVELVKLKDKKTTTYQVWIHPKPEHYKVSSSWERIIKSLTPGEHNFRVEMFGGSNNYQGGAEAIVAGEFKIIKGSGENFDYGKTFDGVEAKMTDPDLEKEMLVAARDYAKVNNYKEDFQAVKIANRDWTIIYHELTGAVVRRIIDVHCLALWPDGHCSTQKFVFGQEYMGKDFSNTVRFHGVTYGSYPENLNCK
jgi:phosphoenolpyruvate synthase/pyruvate phosphate dikinase